MAGLVLVGVRHLLGNISIGVLLLLTNRTHNCFHIYKILLRLFVENGTNRRTHRFIKREGVLHHGTEAVLSAHRHVDDHGQIPHKKHIY